jgi:CRP-like cAMP-binding protein
MHLETMAGLPDLQIKHNTNSMEIIEPLYKIQAVIDYWNGIYEMPEALVNDICSLVKVQTYQKGDRLLVPGKVSNYASFILEGLVKSFYTKDDGVTEVVTKFLYEETIITSIFSFYSRQPGNEYIVALEDTTVASLHYDSMQELLKNHPVFNAIIRVTTERYLFFPGGGVIQYAQAAG